MKQWKPRKTLRLKLMFKTLNNKVQKMLKEILINVDTRLFGDHRQTGQTKSSDSQVHDGVIKLGVLLGSVGHRVKIHKITSATGKERGDIEIISQIKRLRQDSRLQS